jgi:hypothetical protein
MDGQENAGRPRRFCHRYTGGKVGPEGLLHDGRHALGDGALHQLLVRLHARDDIDEAELLVAQHRIGIGVPTRHPEGVCGGLCLGGIDVADGNEIDAVLAEIPPGMKMVLRKEPAANDAKAYPVCHRDITCREVSTATDDATG